MKGRVLIIAGSDSSGGAGIQADLKAVTALGGYAMTAITSLTAQNTLGVYGVYDVSPDFVVDQISVVLEDIGADCIKIGMLHRPEIIRAVATFLKSKASDIPLVIDPVMVAKGGANLLKQDAIKVLIDELLPMADLLTPNLPEAVALSEVRENGSDQKIEMAQRLMSTGARAVLIKGGHDAGEVLEDVLLTGEGGLEVFKTTRIDTSQTHGTGCTLASAIAAGLAQGMELRDSVIRGQRYVLKAIKTAPGFGGGFGPLNHCHTVQLNGK